MIYNIKTNYIQGEPPSSSDLNRRGLILESQLSGALEIFGEGVIEGFAVSETGGSYAVTAGTAIIRAGDDTLVLAKSTATLPLAGVAPGEINYVHLGLAIPELPGQAETVLGDPPVLVVSEEEELPASILLAEVSASGEVTDRRIFIAINALSARVAQLETDVGYTDADRAIGTVATRLGNINAGIYDDADLRAQIAALAEQLAALTGGEAGDLEEVENESSIVASTLMRLESFTVSIHPDYANATTTSLDQPRYAGYGQLLDGGGVSPNIDGGGNAVVDFELNSVHG